MARMVRDFQIDEDHALNVLIGGSVVIMAIGFVAAVNAISHMR